MKRGPLKPVKEVKTPTYAKVLSSVGENVAVTNLGVTNSDSYNQSIIDINELECSNCVLLETQLRSALRELESIKLITKLLQEEIGKASPHGD